MGDTRERSLADFIHPLAPHLPPALISAAALRDIERVARLLPAALAHYLLGFECRLAESTAAADFLVCASAELGGRQALAAHERLADHPAWRRVHEFAVEWNKPGGVLHGAVDTLWLEFDIAPARDDVPPPNVFFGIQAHDDPAIVDAGLALLLGRRPRAQVENQLHRCMAALLPDAHVSFVGVMLARVDDASPDSVRLVVYAPSFERVVAYLERVGWQGSFDALRRSVEPFTSIVDYVWLNLDVGLQVGPRLGLECYFFGQAQPPREARWQALLDRAVELRILHADKARCASRLCGSISSDSRRRDVAGRRWSCLRCTPPAWIDGTDPRAAPPETDIRIEFSGRDEGVLVRHISMSGLHDALEAWREVLGPEHVIVDRSACAAAETATFATHQRIAAIIRPGSREHVQECMRIANRFRTPIYPISTGKNWGYGSRVPTSDGCTLMELRRLDGIVDFDEQLGYVTVQPGVTFRQLAALLRERQSHLMMSFTGQHHGFESHRQRGRARAGIRPVRRPLRSCLRTRGRPADG